jgi:Bystin
MFDPLLQGFLLPLCAAGDCSLREAVIVAAVLRRVSLPVGLPARSRQYTCKTQCLPAWGCQSIPDNPGKS